MTKELTWPTNNAEQCCGQRIEENFKCEHFAEFCAGFHEIFGFHRLILSLLYFRAGGLAIENLIKAPLIYNVSYFNLGLVLCLRGKRPHGDGTRMQAGNILTNLIPIRARPEKPGPTYNSAADNQKLPKQKSFKNWTTLSWQNCRQS